MRFLPDRFRRERAIRNLAHRLPYLVALGLTAILAAFIVPSPRIGLGILTFGLLIILASLIVRAAADREKLEARQRFDLAASTSANDPSPVFLTDPEGQIRFRNAAATSRFGARGDSISQVISRFVASPPATIRRMRIGAERTGSAREDLIAGAARIRLTATRLSDRHILWRYDDFLERGAHPGGHESSGVPRMTVSKAGTVLFMNESLKKALGGRVSQLGAIVDDLPLRNGAIHQIRSAAGPMPVRLYVIEGSLGRKEIFLMPAGNSTEAAQAPLNNLELLPVAMLRLSDDGRILESNRPARDLIGIDEGDDKNFAEVVDGLGRPVQDWLHDARHARQRVSEEFLRAHMADREVFLQVTLSVVEQEEGTELFAILNDATKLKTMEAQFIQSQKMQAIGQLAGGVAHDFNNLLTAISGHCDLLMLRHDEGDQDYGDLVQISQNANRAASLVGQLLAFSRKQTLKTEILDVGDILDDLTHLLNRLVGEKVTLALGHMEDMPPIRADRRQLEQVILNLVVNARDAMPDGGRIRIEARLETLSEPYFRDNVRMPPGDYVVIMVHDQGTGIAREALQKIFEPFYTTKKTGEGTGLGLSMAYGIVKQTGGYIFADSAVGTGTTFTLFFPAVEPKKVEDPLPVDRPALGPAVAHEEDGVVLLVEDEAPVRAFASRALALRGYKVVEAECAESALDLLSDPALKVDIFVTDVIMPGMDGPTWVSRALETRPDTKVIFVSGYAEENFAEQQAKIPNSVFLPKPFSLTELAQTVSNQLH